MGLRLPIHPVVPDTRADMAGKAVKAVAFPGILSLVHMPDTHIGTNSIVVSGQPIGPGLFRVTDHAKGDQSSWLRIVVLPVL
jgi:hypothetical protein